MNDRLVDYDPAAALVDPESIAIFVADAFETGDAAYIAKAMGVVARAKGMTEKTVLFKHVLRNAMIPILTNIGLSLPGIFVGSFLIETFFSIPGLGREIITAVNRSDFPVIKAVTVYLAILTMLINLLVDVMYKYVDPRVSFK